MGRARSGIDLVAGGRSKALVADRQAGMTHYIWRWRRTSERDGDILTHTTEQNAMCVSDSGEVHGIGNKSDGNGTAGLS